MRSIMLMSVAVLALAGCRAEQPGREANAAAASEARASLSQAEAEKIVAGAEAAWAGGRIEQVMANYADEAVVFDTGSLAPTTDRNVQTRANASFLTMKPADFRVDSRHVQPLDADTIVASGVLAFIAQAGASRQLMRTRYTQVYQRQADGRWLIVHEHMSAPPPGSALP
ncbi:MAG: nuclear transport factor 2 family protein [Pseudomonadota bacterium]|nr:nuclear transport factor 2 family protein [Pseudomonadota bacterium]